jgi:DNA-binding response OmpR family regulator
VSSEETEQSEKIAEQLGAFTVRHGALPSAGGYMRLLLIEPDPSIRARLTRQLTRATGEVVDVKQAGSLSAALDYLRSNSVDAVITALKLPEASGGAIVRALLAHHETLPIVLAIRRTEHAEMLASLSEGADDFIDKGLRTRSSARRPAVNWHTWPNTTA